MTTNVILGTISKRYLPQQIATVLAGTARTVGKADTWKPICLFAAVCSVGATVTA